MSPYPVKRTIPITLTVVVGLVLGSPPALSAHGSRELDWYSGRLGNTSYCKNILSEQGRGDINHHGVWGGDFVVFLNGTERTQWSAGGYCQRDPATLTNSPPNTLYMRGNIWKSYDWEEGIPKHCWHSPTGVGSWNLEPQWGHGWFMQFPTACGGFTPDPDGSGGAVWSDNTGVTDWRIIAGGSEYSGVVPPPQVDIPQTPDTTKRYYLNDTWRWCPPNCEAQPPTGTKLYAQKSVDPLNA